MSIHLAVSSIGGNEMWIIGLVSGIIALTVMVATIVLYCEGLQFRYYSVGSLASRFGIANMVFGLGVSLLGFMHIHLQMDDMPYALTVLGMALVVGIFFIYWLFSEHLPAKRRKLRHAASHVPFTGPRSG